MVKNNRYIGAELNPNGKNIDRIYADFSVLLEVVSAGVKYQRAIKLNTLVKLDFFVSDWRAELYVSFCLPTNQKR